MIGVDTNVLLRLLVVEDPKQNALAKSFFAARSAADPAHISLVVMAELVWVLRAKYKYGYDQVAPAIQSLLDSDDFAVEARDLVEWAVERYTRSKIDFSDLLIAHANERSGCGATVTFDQTAAKLIPGMELLK